jgi:hypothetical protein
MKKIAPLFFLFLVFNQIVVCQDADKTINITVSGSGKTLEDAKQDAFRSAINQSIGTFINANPDLTIDQSTLDQIATFSSGTIKSFSILNKSQLPDGKFGLTLKAIVSLTKLRTQVELKGISIEINGSEFASNIKQQILNEQSEIKAVYETIGLLHEPMQISFNYKINVSTPKALDAESKNWKIPILVIVTTNNNMDVCINYFIKTLTSISLSLEEVKIYQNLNKPVFPVLINYNGLSKKVYLRKEASVKILNTFTDQWSFYNKLFTLKCGQEELNVDYESKFFFISGNNYSSAAKTINFLTAGQRSATFTWEDKRTLAQIENMSNYEIKPKGIVSKFKYGGFVVYENNGHGLVCSLFDMGKMDWDAGKNSCDELILNYYTDWRLPTKADFKEIHENLFKIGIGAFVSDYYWSFEETYDHNGAWYEIFANRDQNFTSKNQRFNIRAVRSF